MRCIYNNYISTGSLQSFRPDHGLFTYSYRSSDPQSAELVLACHWVFLSLFNVFNCNKAYKVKVFINYWKFLDPVLMKYFLRFLKSGSHRSRDQPFFGHDFIHFSPHVSFKPEVPVCQNADKLIILSNRDSRYPVFLHYPERLGQSLVGLHSYRIDNHTAFRLFNPVHL